MLLVNSILIPLHLQTEVVAMEDTFEDLCHRVEGIQELNDNQPLQALVELQRSLDSQFSEAAQVAESLDTQLDDFETKRQGLQVGKTYNAKDCRLIRKNTMM